MKLRFIFLLLSFPVIVTGQHDEDSLLSVRSCVRLSFTGNLKFRQMQMEQKKSHYRLKEAVSYGLPQIASFASFEDYLNVPTTMVSGEIIGQPGIMVPIQLGTKYNAVAGVQAGQMIYDASFFESVKLFRKMAEISNLNMEQAREELTYAIVQMYLFIQISNRQLAMADSNLIAYKKIYEHSEQHFRNGLIRKADLDRVTVAVNTLRTDRDNLQIARNQQLYMLKYLIGIKPDRQITLTDSIEKISFYPESVDTTFCNQTGMKLLEQQKELAAINRTLAKAARVPSVAVYALFNYQAQVEKPEEIEKNDNWYKTSYIGIKLTIPIFEGNGIKSKVNQRNIEFTQAETSITDLRNELTAKMMTASERLLTNRESEERSRFSRDLAANIFRIYDQQYSQGLKPLTDVLNAQSEYNMAYISWLNSLMQIKLSELEIAELTGAINSLYSF